MTHMRDIREICRFVACPIARCRCFRSVGAAKQSDNCVPFLRVTQAIFHISNVRDEMIFGTIVVYA